MDTPKIGERREYVAPDGERVLYYYSEIQTSLDCRLCRRGTCVQLVERFAAADAIRVTHGATPRALPDGYTHPAAGD